MQKDYINEKSEYLLVMVQRDRETGQEFVIDSGIKVESLKATTLEEADAEAQLCLLGDERGYRGYLNDDGEYSLESAFLVKNIGPMPIAAMKSAYRHSLELERRASQENKERAEFERLKAKFGG